MMKRRVVVTGLGAITPLGNTVPEFWAGVKEGKVGIAPITKFDTTEYKVKLAAEVKDFVAKDRGAVLEYGVPGFFFLAACVILVKEREKIVSWWRRNRPPRRYWLWAFTTFWMLLFLIMETVVALEGVSRL